MSPRPLVLAPLMLGACFGPLCEVSTPIFQLDGGPAICLEGKTCPRPSNVFVCTTTADTSSQCVTCRDTACVMVTKEACR